MFYFSLSLISLFLFSSLLILCSTFYVGLVVDDPRMLISYFSVFMIACFKLRADNLSSLTGSSMYRQKMSQSKNTFVWKDLK
jgi:hypothetical protein